MTHVLKGFATAGRIALHKTSVLAPAEWNCSLCTDSHRATNRSWLRTEFVNRSSNNNHHFETSALSQS